MNKTALGLISSLLVSTCFYHNAYCDPSNQPSAHHDNKPFKDGDMDVDEQGDDPPITPDQETSDSLNKQSLEDSKPHPARTTVGIAYISVHVINNIKDSDFPKVVASARNAIKEAKKDDSDFNGKTLISAIRKSMNSSNHQSDKFTSLMKEYKVERPEASDVVLDQLPETIACAEDNGDDDENADPPSYCYSFNIVPRQNHGKNVITINGNTVWQGSDADHELDSDQYHLDIGNTKTAWFYRGLPADAKGNKRLFLFELTVAIDPDKMTDKKDD